MKTGIIVLIGLFSCLKGVYAQVQIMDAESHEPIPNVHILSENGALLTTSDLEGFFYPTNIAQRLKTKTVELSHIAYKNKKIALGAPIKNNVCYLYPDDIYLNIVTVHAREADYLVLKGFFRSYQLDNHIPKAYMDGIATYFIPIHGKKINVKLIANRTFRNPEIYDEKLAKNKGITAFSGDRTGPPYIERKTILDELPNSTLSGGKKDHNRDIVMKSDTIGIARFDTINHTADIHVDIIGPENKRTRSIFTYVVEHVNFSVTERYAYENALWNKKSNLLLRTAYRKQYVYDKKHKKDAVQVESLHEFYVFEKAYISKREFKKEETTPFFGPRKTSYSTAFWIDAEWRGVPKLPDFINDLLSKKLILY